MVRGNIECNIFFEFFEIVGVKRLCKDAEFMLGIKTSIYYRLCWSIITPLTMAAILLYTLSTYQPLQYNGYTYSNGLYSTFYIILCKNLKIFFFFQFSDGVCQLLVYSSWCFGVLRQYVNNLSRL